MRVLVLLVLDNVTNGYFLTNSRSVYLQFGFHVRHHHVLPATRVKDPRATGRLLLLPLRSVAGTVLGRGGLLLHSIVTTPPLLVCGGLLQNKLFHGNLVIFVDDVLVIELLLRQSLQVHFERFFVELGATAAANSRSNLIENGQHLFLVLEEILVQMLSLSTLQLRVVVLLAEVQHLTDQMSNGFLDEVTVLLHLLEDNLLLPKDIDILLNGRPAILESLHLPVGLLLVISAPLSILCLKLHFPVGRPSCLKINRVDLANTVHVELLPLDGNSDVLHLGISCVRTDELIVGLVDRVVHLIHAEGLDGAYFGFRDVPHRSDGCGIVHLHVLNNQHVVRLALGALRRPDHQVVVGVLEVDGV